MTEQPSKEMTVLAVESATETLRQALLHPPLSIIVKAIGEDSKLHIVGGTVRDVFMGRDPQDFDLATVLKPEEASRRLSKAGVYIVATGLKHGTITAVLDNHHIEITTFRKPGAASLENLQSSFSDSIEEDLQGRDFTINAMAFSARDKTLLDPWGGIRDLEARTIRAVESAETRFTEDPLRIVRMIRLGTAAGFKIEKATFESAKRLARSMDKVSVERVRVELEKILLSDFPGDGIRKIKEIGLLELILPELLPAVDFPQNRYHTQDVFEHTLSVLNATPRDLLLRLTALFHDVGKPGTLSVDEQGERHFYEHEKLSEVMCRDGMRRLKFSNDQVHDTTLLVRMHMRPIECGPAGVRRLMRDLGPMFDRFRAFQIADSPPAIPKAEFMKRVAGFDSMVEAELERQKKAEKRLAVNGNDLLELGFQSGPFLGSVLKELEEIVIENPDLNSREFLLEKAKQRLLQAK